MGSFKIIYNSVLQVLQQSEKHYKPGGLILQSSGYLFYFACLPLLFFCSEPLKNYELFLLDGSRYCNYNHESLQVKTVWENQIL